MGYQLKVKDGSAEFGQMLSQLGEDGEEIAKRAIFDAAGILVGNVRKNLQGVLSTEATGQLLASLGISRMKTKCGVISAKIGFSGYDDQGTANQLKARILESGSSKQQSRPFFRPAVNQSRAAIDAAMKKTADAEIEKRSK